MKLIADSGSTKTSWALIADGATTLIETQGINPFQQSGEEIGRIVSEELLPAIKGGMPEEIYFYGAGCTAESSPIVRTALEMIFGRETLIEVNSDMLGAARGLCGNDAGIVAILGTGANSCYYDGKEITANVSPLGFILGDEGSGAYIGKRLVGDVLKRQLPDHVCKAFLEETHLTTAEIIQRTYREPLPNRFLASLSPFCARHRNEPEIHNLLRDCFMQFFVRNVRAYSGNHIHFVGSIAYYYREEIAEVAEELGYTVGKTIQAPIDGLVEYHRN